MSSKTSLLEWEDYQKWLPQLKKLPDPLHTPSPPHPEQIAFDSRTVSAGQWFLPLKGENTDGHRYIVSALNKGASGFFANSSFLENLPAKVIKHGIFVTDTKQALFAIAKGYRQKLPVKVIAVTGSSGKTTVKEMLAHVLPRSLKSPANFNTEIGASQTLLKLRTDTSYAIVECGARNRGDLSLLAEITLPDIALCLNIGTAHVGIFGSATHLLNTKTELYRDSPPHCVCIANADCPSLLEKAQETDKKLITFGYNPSADVRITDTTTIPDLQTVKIEARGRTYIVQSETPHKAFPLNVAAVCAVCLTLNLEFTEMRDAFISLPNIAGRFHKIEHAGLTIIDDSYNANPQSVALGLQSLQTVYPNHRKILVLGDMLELGEDSARYHRQLNAEVRAVQPALLITVGKLASHIATGLDDIPTHSFPDVSALVDEKIDFRLHGNLIYLKASNAVGLKTIVSALTSGIK